jgi:hypothetical protein
MQPPTSETAMRLAAKPTRVRMKETHKLARGLLSTKAEALLRASRARSGLGRMGGAVITRGETDQDERWTHLSPQNAWPKVRKNPPGQAGTTGSARGKPQSSRKTCRFAWGNSIRTPEPTEWCSKSSRKSSATSPVS